MVRVSSILVTAVGLSLAGLTAASAQSAGGSYRRSCTNISQDGPILEAECRDVRGGYVPSRIDLRRCGGQPVANINGRLACGNSGGGQRYRGPDDDDDRRGPPPGPPGYDPYGRPPGPPRY